MNIYEALALTVLISIVLGLAFSVWFLLQHIKGRTKAEQEFLKRHGFGSHFKQQRKWESDFLYGDKKNENSVPEAILEATENRRGEE